MKIKEISLDDFLHEMKRDLNYIKIASPIFVRISHKEIFKLQFRDNAGKIFCIITEKFGKLPAYVAVSEKKDYSELFKQINYFFCL